MTKDTKLNWFTKVTDSRPAWFAVGGMLLVYLSTLSHWGMPDGLRQTEIVAGWTWRPELFGPVTFLVTYPLRCLPGAWVHGALAFLNACCAALVLALLFRSVSLLPHGSTQEVRRRVTNSERLLTIPSAWMPPVMAVLFCGLEVVFWVNSTTPTGEIFDLLFFACLVRCLLEYRVSRSNKWLYKLSLVYGLALANNWAMIGFAPVFLLLLVWLCFAPVDLEGPDGLENYVSLRMLGWFSAGFSVFLLLPMIAAFTGAYHSDFWQLLRHTVHAYLVMPTVMPRYAILFLAVPALLPIAFMSIRWARIGTSPDPMTALLMETLYNGFCGLLLLLGIATMLDFPVSPRFQGHGFPCLPVYFLSALGIGFVCGYFLVISRPAPATLKQPHLLKPYFDKVPAVMMWIILAVAPLLMLYKNLPYLLQKKSGPLGAYVSRLEKSLPPRGSIIMSEDSGRLSCLRSLLTRNGHLQEYLLIDANALFKEPAYWEFLDARYPSFKLAGTVTNGFNQLTNPVALLKAVRKLSQTRELYYLHPTCNQFGEIFQAEPRGFFYQLKPYAAKAAPFPETLRQNQTFWQAVIAEDLPYIVRCMQRPYSKAVVIQSPWKKFINQLRPRPDDERWAHTAAQYYSCGLNTWGVSMQRAGMTNEAAQCFEKAVLLAPENMSARVNAEYNQGLRAGQQASPREFMAKYGQVVKASSIGMNGPIDEPGFCLAIGQSLGKAGFARQAITELQRSRALAPDNVDSLASLSGILLFCGDYTNALKSARQVLQRAPRNSEALFVKGTCLEQFKAHAEAVAALTEFLALHNDNLLARFTRGLACLQTGQLEIAQSDFEAVSTGAPQVFQAEYGLGEIAYRKKNIPEAIKHYELFLKKAGTNLAETKEVLARLLELKRGNPPSK